MDLSEIKTIISIVFLLIIGVAAAGAVFMIINHMFDALSLTLWKHTPKPASDEDVYSEISKGRSVCSKGTKIDTLDDIADKKKLNDLCRLLLLATVEYTSDEQLKYLQTLDAELIALNNILSNDEIYSEEVLGLILASMPDVKRNNVKEPS